MKKYRFKGRYVGDIPGFEGNVKANNVKDAREKIENHLLISQWGFIKDSKGFIEVIGSENEEDK